MCLERGILFNERRAMTIISDSSSAGDDSSGQSLTNCAFSLTTWVGSCSSSSYIVADGQSGSSSWRRALFGARVQMLHFFE